jgi:hypothetical protein
MVDLIPVVMVCLVGFAIATVHAQSVEREFRRLLLASFLAHVLAAFAQVWMTRYVWGGGDVLGYTYMGEVLGTLLHMDFTQFMPEVMKMLVHLDFALPVDPGEFPNKGNSTDSMAAFAGIIVFLTGGSAYTLCCIGAMFGYFGQVSIFRAFRGAFPKNHHRRLLICAMLIPSAIFWSSGYLKESIAMLGFGLVILGLERVLRRPTMGPILMLAGGACIVGLFKAYILVGCLAGAAAWLFFRSSERTERIAPGYVIAAIVVAAAGSAAITRVFPTYSLEGLSQQAAYYQEAGQAYDAGSNYTLGDLSEKSLGARLAYAPLALFTALFRPVLIESRSPQVFVNSIETTVVLVLIVRAIWRRGIAGVWTLVKRMPMLAFAIAFVLVFGTGVGFTSTNLGTLSRYRMPLVPFLWSLALVLGADLEAKKAGSPVAPLRGSQRRPPLRAEQL